MPYFYLDIYICTRGWLIVEESDLRPKAKDAACDTECTEFSAGDRENRRDEGRIYDMHLRCCDLEAEVGSAKLRFSNDTDVRLEMPVVCGFVVGVEQCWLSPKAVDAGMLSLTMKSRDAYYPIQSSCRLRACSVAARIPDIYSASPSCAPYREKRRSLHDRLA